jgi:TolB-like protein/Flp pilus assembly protein TadD
LWSQESVLSDWVKDEASEGLKRNILVPVLIEDVTIPLGFRHVQAALLFDWQGETNLPEFKRLLKDVADLLPNKSETADVRREGQVPSEVAKASAKQGRGRRPVRDPSRLGFILGKVESNKISIVLALVLMIVAVAIIIRFFPSRKENVRRSIVVLPLTNGQGNSDMEYLCDGISEGIINNLSQLDGLKVIARTTAFSFKSNSIDPLVIGQKLGVDAVFTGRITQQGSAVIMQADLLSVLDGSQLWGESISRRLSDSFLIQEEVARLISEKLRIRLNRDEQKQLMKHYTETPEAYQLYLKGRHYSRQETQEGIKKGIENYNQAIALDPGYALAYAGLAESYSIAANWVFPLAEAMEKARGAATRALQIDETLAEAHIALGLIKNQYDWQWAQAESEFRRALELRPNYAEAHQWYGDFLMQMGRFNEARLQIGRARELDPLSVFISNELGLISYYEGNYDQAIEQYSKTIAMDSAYISSHILLGRALAQKQMYDQATLELQKARQLDNGADILADLGRYYGLAGKEKEAREILKKLEDLSKQTYISPYYLALLHIGLAEKEQSLDWLEKAYAERSSALIWLKINPTFESLRSEPRFIQLTQRVGLVQ